MREQERLERGDLSGRTPSDFEVDILPCGGSGYSITLFNKTTIDGLNVEYISSLSCIGHAGNFCHKGVGGESLHLSPVREIRKPGIRCRIHPRASLL